MFYQCNFFYKNKPKYKRTTVIDTYLKIKNNKLKYILTSAHTLSSTMAFVLKSQNHCPIPVTSFMAGHIPLVKIEETMMNCKVFYRLLTM